MPGSGHIFIAIIYFVLFTILGICTLVLVINKFKNRDLMKFCMLLILSIAVFSFFQMRKTSNMESAHIGEYKLTNYPNCSDCKMQLLLDNTYTVKNSNKLIESGRWKLQTGDDYYVIEINNGKQFGYNEYRNEGKIKK